MFRFAPSRHLPRRILRQGWSILSIVMLLAVASQPAASIARAADATPVSDGSLFSAAPCPVPIAKPFSEGKDVFCGYVTVPERHSEPTGKTIQLAVIKYASRAEKPATDPLVMLTGGPGGSAVDLFPRILAMEQLGLAKILDGRDIVIIEQRGTLYSKPNLFCDEFVQANLDAYSKSLTPEQENQSLIPAISACRTRLATAGINLSAYNSVENAADIPVVMQALRYKLYNLFGVSYGTMLSLHSMKEQPAMIRSAILDSVVPLQTNFLPMVAQTFWHSLSNVLAKCKADAACNGAYPTLEATLQKTVERLNAAPVTLMPEIEGVKKPYVLTGDRLLYLLFQLSYETRLLARLPSYMTEIAQGNYESVLTYGPIILVDRTSSIGMQFSVLCAEDADFNANDIDLTGIPPYISRIFSEQSLAYLSACKLWNVDYLGESVDEPVRSAIPTLLLAGELDPITPPSFTKTAGATLSKSYYVEFPGVGHGAIGSGPCTVSIMVAFLDNPQLVPDSTCAAALGIKFVLPAPKIAGAAGVVMEPVKLAAIGAASVAPKGWASAQPGTFTDGSNLLAFQVSPGSDPASVVAKLFGGQKVEPNREVKANGATWVVYQLRGSLGGAELAVTVINDKIYLIAIQTDKSDPAALDQLAKEVLQPAIEAFQVS